MFHTVKSGFLGVKDNLKIVNLVARYIASSSSAANVIIRAEHLYNTGKSPITKSVSGVLTWGRLYKSQDLRDKMCVGRVEGTRGPPDILS